MKSKIMQNKRSNFETKMRCGLTTMHTLFFSWNHPNEFFNVPARILLSQTQSSNMGQSHTKPIERRDSSASASSKHAFKPRKYLTRVELVSLQYVFNNLKSTFKDKFECIEPKQFLVGSEPADNSAIY